MNEFQKYQRSIGIIIMLVSVTGVAALYFGSGNHTYAAGLALGSAAGMLKFRMNVMLLMRMATENRNPSAHSANNLRAYLLMAGALLIAYSMKQTFYIWTTFAGLFVPNMILILDGMLRPNAMLRTAVAQDQPGDDADGV